MSDTTDKNDELKGYKIGVDVAYSDEQILIDLHNLGFHGKSLEHLEILENYIKEYGTKERINITKLIESDIEDLPIVDGHLIPIEEIEGVFRYRLEKENVVVQGKFIDLGLTALTHDKTDERKA